MSLLKTGTSLKRKFQYDAIIDSSQIVNENLVRRCCSDRVSSYKFQYEYITDSIVGLSQIVDEILEQHRSDSCSVDHERCRESDHIALCEPENDTEEKILDIVRDEPNIRTFVFQTVTKRRFRPWDFDRVVEEGTKLHNSKFEYIELTKVLNAKTLFLAHCLTCDDQFKTNGERHIQRKFGGCRCKGGKKFTLKEFLRRSKLKHGEKFDYSLIVAEDIQSQRSHVNIICKTCSYDWSPSIGDHITGYGCPQCSGVARWTMDRFLKAAKRIHAEKYNYKEVVFHTRDTKFFLSCNECGNRFKTSISKHISRQSGCRRCAGNDPWTYERFMTEALEVHKDKYDYSKVIADHIQGCRSPIPVRCNQCDHAWNPTINNHINHGTGCPSCAGKLKWTSDRFVVEAKVVHGEKYNYNEVDEITSNHSPFFITCNACEYRWKSCVSNHLGSKNAGCPSCAGNAPWTYDRFLHRIKNKYDRHLYDYSDVSPEDIKNWASYIKLRCTTCDYKWAPSINVHFNECCGCPSCAGVVRWTLTSFLAKSVEVHQNKYDYSKIVEADIENQRSRVKIICRACHTTNVQIIHNHISGSGCLVCSGHTTWTLITFIKRSQEIHRDRFNYDNITEGDIAGAESHIPITCNKCQFLWRPTISSHIHRKSGCPKCNYSKGEQACEEILVAKGISFIPQYILETLPKKKFDFYFEHDNRKCLLEYDGGQHFEFTKFFHKTEETFKKRQHYDVLKTQEAINSEYFIIRIDYTCFDQISYHLNLALASAPTSMLYFSSPYMYEYISKHLD